MESEKTVNEMIMKNSEVGNEIAPGVEMISSFETSENVIKGDNEVDVNMKLKDKVSRKKKKNVLGVKVGNGGAAGPSRRRGRRAGGGFTTDVGDRRVLISVKRRNNRKGVMLPIRPDRFCTNVICGTRETSMWRKGPLGINTLCNACGLYFKKQGVSRIIVPVNDVDADADANGGANFLYFVEKMKLMPPKYD